MKRSERVMIIGFIVYTVSLVAWVSVKTWWGW